MPDFQAVKTRVMEALKSAIELQALLFWTSPFIGLLKSPRVILEWMVYALVTPAGAVLLLGIVSVSVAHEIVKQKTTDNIGSAQGPNGVALSHGQSAKAIFLSVRNLCVFVLPNYALVAFLWTFPEVLVGAAFWLSIASFFLVAFALYLVRPRRLGLIFPPRVWRFGHPSRSLRV